MPVSESSSFLIAFANRLDACPFFSFGTAFLCSLKTFVYKTNEIKSWTGGNTDFSDLGDDVEPIARVETISTDVELIHED